MKDISIIVTVEENGQPLLRSLLPKLLAIPYDGGLEVIVVDKKNDKDLREWLEDMETNYQHLNHTFCPASARGLDLHRLALILGAKAANFDFLVFLPLDESLATGSWLPKLVSSASEGHDVTIGLTRPRSRWKWFKGLFRRTYSVFRPGSSIILCRRDVLLQAKNVKLSGCNILKLYQS